MKLEGAGVEVVELRALPNTYRVSTVSEAVTQEPTVWGRDCRSIQLIGKTSNCSRTEDSLSRSCSSLISLLTARVALFPEIPRRPSMF